MNFETNYCGGIFYLIIFIFACIYMNRLYYGNGRYDGYKRPLVEPTNEQIAKAIGKEIDGDCLGDIRAARAQEPAEQPVSQEYQDHLVNQSFDWAAMAAKHQFMEGYRIGLAEMREKCAVICEAKQSYSAMHANTEFAAVIRSINFEGDTGFRPVSEMIAEHKQDPKKAAAIEKAKMRKAEQEPLMDYERINALREGEQNGAEDAYFFVRPENDTPTLRKMFCQGFERGFHKGLKYASHVRTKDLTDDEVFELIQKHCVGNMSQAHGLVRAAITADREKNK